MQLGDQLARAPLSLMAMTMPYARKDGLAATAGRPDLQTAMTAAVLGIGTTLLAVPWTAAFAAAAVTAIGAFCMAVLAQWQIGGQTGDVLGGTEQVCETAILLLLTIQLA